MMNESILTRYPDLEDGTMLIKMKENYLNDRSKESLVSLLSCLRESFVRVPMSVTMSDNDRKRLDAAVKEHRTESFSACDEVRMHPELLLSPDGRRFFPMFSRMEEIPEKYARQYSIFEEAVPNCIAMAKNMDGLNGLVLDAFAHSMIIPFDIAEMILKAKRMHG